MASHNHETCKSNLMARAAQTCTDKNVRLTDQRKEVLACVAASHAAVGAYEIIERMAGHGPKPAPITIYRALDFLLEQNLIHKVESKNAFVACVCAHENSAATLLICESCGNVDEVVHPTTQADLQKLANQQGFKLNRAMIELSGTCSQCANV
jgi:Fur family transcriptional regulator, zinc uptake regulator